MRMEIHQRKHSIILRPKRKTLCYRRCGWQEKSSPGQPQIYFFKLISQRFSLFLFSFLCFILYFCFCPFVCLLKLKIYILIHIWLCRWVSDKKSFTHLICWNKTTLFWHISTHFCLDKCNWGTMKSLEIKIASFCEHFQKRFYFKK